MIRLPRSAFGGGPCGSVGEKTTTGNPVRCSTKVKWSEAYLVAKSLNRTDYFPLTHGGCNQTEGSVYVAAGLAMAAGSNSDSNTIDAGPLINTLSTL
jgi:hypothetical protein